VGGLAPDRSSASADDRAGETILLMASTDPTTSNGDDPGIPTQEAAERAGVSVGTLRRWARDGLIPQYDGFWSPGAVSHARIVARLRERGHSLEDIRRATEQGRLAFGYIEELFPPGGDRTYTWTRRPGRPGSNRR
jgi:hypothetical protein